MTRRTWVARVLATVLVSGGLLAFVAGCGREDSRGQGYYDRPSFDSTTRRAQPPETGSMRSTKVPVDSAAVRETPSARDTRSDMRPPADAGVTADTSAASPGPSVTVSGLPPGPARLPNYAALYASVEPTVVSLYTTRLRRPGPGFRWSADAVDSLGSGVIVSPTGEVLTNHHVVENAVGVWARLSDGRAFDARIIGTDPPTDLALLQLEGLDGPLQAAQFGDSEALPVGAWVLAIGNPLGLEHTATRGIVSAKGRRQLGDDPSAYVDYIQTDAAINPGSSGGPLFNLRGEVVGINAALNAAAVGIAFAIPSNMAREVVERLSAAGTIERGWLGLILQRPAHNIDRVRVAGVLTGSPAEKAGLQRGDVVLALDDVAIETPFDLRWRVAMAGVGERVTLTIQRDGERRVISARLASLDSGDRPRFRRP